MEETKFEKINGAEYARKGIESGELVPVTAVKFARIKARVGVVGEEIVTYSQGGIEEKRDTVTIDSKTGQPGWVVTKLDENGEVVIDEHGHDNTWIIADSTFKRKYEVDHAMAEGVYKPAGGPQVFVPILMDVTLEQWGSEMQIAAGGWLNITDPNDIYGISQRDFDDTYRIVNEEVPKKTN